MNYRQGNTRLRVSSPILLFLLTLNLYCARTEPALQSGTDTDTNSDNDSDIDSDTDNDYLFTVNARISNFIGTVGIVEWSIDHDPLDSAFIEFGLGKDYDMIAPVDLNEPNYKTFLLGMKPSQTYHFRVVAIDGQDTLISSDHILQTGPVSNFLPLVTNDIISSVQLAGGFILTCTYVEGEIFVIDADGEYVWWAIPDMHRCSRARMSYDGKHVFVRDVNVNDNEGVFLKLDLEGRLEEFMDVPGSHHDFTVLPDESIGFIYFDEGADRCDDIVEMSPDGTLKTIFHLADEITPPDTTDGCHSNSIHYHVEEETYTVSILNTNQYVKVTRSGELVWILGGAESSFSGADWLRQHGHHLLENGNILLFNNGTMNDDAIILEYALDETNWQASLAWTFLGGYQSIILGDVQRLLGGNTLVTYSSDETMSEINPKGEIVRKITFDGAGGIGYSMWRDSLYGPPPK